MKSAYRSSVRLPLSINRVLLIGLMISGVFLFNAQAQSKKRIKDVGDNCEIISATLAYVLYVLNKVKDEEHYLIIIGKTPTNVSPSYTRRQVEDALKYFNFVGQLDKNKTIIGFNKSSNKLSQFQFFVSGKLVAEIKYHPKAKLCFSDGWSF